SAIFINLISERIPISGPKTRNPNPKIQLVESTITGNNQIVIFVMAKPNVV
ncbi:unnamed protein product, partial [marine sediment metagenome]